MDIIIHSQMMERPSVSGSELFKFLEIIDFKKLSDMVEPKLRSRQGRAGFSVESMIKATFLANSHHLSDRDMERELQNRLDF